MMKQNLASEAPGKPRIVIIGAGFGGLAVVRGLGAIDAEVTLIDRQNHHLFQPLLYQVATAALSPADIAAPIRTIVKDHKQMHVLLDEVSDIDAAEAGFDVQLSHHQDVVARLLEVAQFVLKWPV